MSIDNETLITMVNELQDTWLYQVSAGLDGTRQFVFISNSIHHLNEVPPEAVLADAGVIYRQIDPEYAHELARLETECLQTLKTFRIETRFILPSGRIRWFRLTSTPHRKKDGDVVWNGLATDITRYRDMMATNRLVTLVTNSSIDIMAALDLKYRYIVANKAYLEKHNITADEIVGRHYAEIVGDEKFKEFKPLLDRCFAGETMQIETPMVFPKLGTRHMDATYYPLRDDSDCIIGIVGVGRDITERKRMEAEHLEMQNMLRHSQKMEAVGQLAGGIAHDLNNLLTPIMGYSEFLTQSLDESDRAHKYSKHISTASHKAKDLVHKLLAFSRKQTLEFQRIDVNTLIKEFQPFIQRTIRENVSITFKPAIDLPMLLADKGQLEQVLMNLVVNAQDAMPDGGQLTITTSTVDIDDNSPGREQLTVNGPHVIITVADTGVGMEAHIRAKIFDPFFTTKGQKGTGLGLATAWGIAFQHEGAITVDSTPGAGTSFSVYLPVQSQSIFPDELYQTKTPCSVPPPKKNGSEIILLVEDDLVVREVVTEQLRTGGYDVLIAESPQLALDMLAQNGNDIQLLISDVIMPEMNGKELYLRARACCPNLKVIYISGYPDDIVSTSGILEKDVNFIQKPFGSETLLKEIDCVLNARAPRPPGSAHG